MKIKRFLLLICICCFSFIATGCGEPLYVMTEEEEAIITLYASKTVTKFNKNQPTGICNVRVKPGELDESYEADEDIAEENSLENPDEDNLDENDVDIDSSETVDGEEDLDSEIPVDSSDGGYAFTDAIGIDGVEFSCSQFDVSEVFQTRSFATSKVNGKKYVVLNITAKNTSGSSIDFSSISDRSYSLSLNGEEQDTVYVPVSNNLDTYDGVLKAGEEKSFVLVFLFSNSSLENITSLDFYVTSDGTTRGTTI